MSNSCGFGVIKDGRFSSICVNGALIIDSNRNYKGNNATFTTLNVRQDTTIKGNIVINGEVNTEIKDLVAFWWNPNTRITKWATYNGITGKKRGPNIGYSTTEERSSGSKTQYGKGSGNYKIVTIVNADYSGDRYFLEHDTASGTYQKTNLGSDPANYNETGLITYDAVASEYIGVANTSTPSGTGLTKVDSISGNITSFTLSMGGTVSPEVYSPLDVEIIGDVIVVCNRNDVVKGKLLFFDRSTGQYTGTSTFGGTILPGDNSFVWTFMESASTWWIQSMAYDSNNFRLYVIIGIGGGIEDRAMGYIEDTDEATLLSNLESGTYDIKLSQNYPGEVINALTWINSN